MKVIEGEGYNVAYESAGNTVVFSGTLRLGGLAEYKPIVECLESSFEQSDNLILDLKNLDFLNSSGIAMFSKFVIGVRNNSEAKLSVIGNKEITWQGKSLKNLQRLMPTLNLVLE